MTVMKKVWRDAWCHRWVWSEGVVYRGEIQVPIYRMNVSCGGDIDPRPHTLLTRECTGPLYGILIASILHSWRPGQAQTLIVHQCREECGSYTMGEKVYGIHPNFSWVSYLKCACAQHPLHLILQFCKTNTGMATNNCQRRRAAAI